MAKPHKGKKVFTHEVKLPTGEVSTDIRVSPHGWFSAAIGLDSFEDKDIGKVRAWIEETVRRSKTLEFAPWIEIESPEKDSYRYGRGNDKGTAKDTTLSVSFKVLLLSTETFSDNKPGWNGNVRRFRLHRACKVTKKLEVVVDESVAEDHRDERKEIEDEDIHGKDRRRNRLLPYTPQRYQALVALIESIEAARKRLDDMLVQSDDGARMLDTAAGRLLLAAPEEKR